MRMLHTCCGEIRMMHPIEDETAHAPPHLSELLLPKMNPFPRDNPCFCTVADRRRHRCRDLWRAVHPAVRGPARFQGMPSQWPPPKHGERATADEGARRWPLHCRALGLDNLRRIRYIQVCMFACVPITGLSLQTCRCRHASSASEPGMLHRWSNCTHPLARSIWLKFHHLA